MNTNEGNKIRKDNVRFLQGLDFAGHCTAFYHHRFSIAGLLKTYFDYEIFG